MARMEAGPEARNRELMVTLDDAFNSRDWETFEELHRRDVAVHWPGWSTRGSPDRRRECVALCATFPDAHVDNRPYRVFFADREWTCLIARFTGTFNGSMTTPDGHEIAPTGRTFEVDFCTVARWQDGQIAEENLFYDRAEMLRQVGVVGD